MLEVKKIWMAAKAWGMNAGVVLCAKALADLKNLKRVAQEACEEAFNRADEFNEPINWGDFGCLSAECCVDEEGRLTYRVYIEEAAPECCKVNQFIAHYLEKKGFPEVIVSTEW